MKKRVIGVAAALTFCAMLAPRAEAGWVNGWWVYPYRYFANDQVTRRPFSASERGLSVSDWRISNLALNHKGMRISPTYANGGMWVYRWIAIWHCEISDAWRSSGVHSDFIQIQGGGNSQPIPTSVLVQDVQMHDGNALPLIIQDGWFDKITLKDIRIWNTTIGAQIVANEGHVNQVIIDHCPGIQVLLIGAPGSIDVVYVKNSPGIKVINQAGAKGFCGARIVYLN